MDFKDIKAIIDNSKILKIKRGLFLCIYKDWVLKVNNNNESQHEYQIYYKGVHITTEYKFTNKFDFEKFTTIKELIDKENSCYL